jgi:CheY-like chemotaxis protein
MEAGRLKPSRPRILVVEDEAVNKMLAQRMLSKLGFSPDFANHGEEAIVAAKASPYDIILMDLHMPVIDGFEATTAIRDWERRQSGSRKPAKIVAFTACVTEDIRRRCAAVGMDEFIGKPATLERLREVIGEVSGAGEAGAA